MAPSEASTMTSADDVYSRIRGVFGRYKAEWLREDLYPLFRQPGYFPEFEEPRPTVLVGGRGTGKTTVLRCLSYQGLYELQERSREAALNAPYIGLYWCIDPNRVTAFDGPELPQRSWRRLFGHYVNLEIVEQLSRYARWFEEVTGEPLRVDKHMLERVALSLHVPAPDSIVEFSDVLDDAIVRLEATINSVVDGRLGQLSLTGAPIEYMTSALASDPRLDGKTFYFLLDEFEQLNQTQQVVFNSLIKRGRDRFVFKIGVKEGGWRTHATLVENEPLVHPADYDLIDLGERLSDGSYSRFAAEVCDARLSRVLEAMGNDQISIQNAFESLSPEEEAQLLGVKNRVMEIREQLLDHPTLGESLSLLSDLELYYVQRRAQVSGIPLEDEMIRLKARPEVYLRNYRDNYRHSLLYTISEHAGRGIQKYYAGWDTLVRVSGGNIRYMVELVERAFAKHGGAGRPIAEPVSARHQTDACIDVGKKYTQEVQSLDPEGAKLTFLLLGLGRFFNLLARNSQGRQPDSTSFVISDSDDAETNARVATLMRAAVMHQVLRRSPATKATSHIDAKVWEYTLHPIFSAFFVVPYQRKRRLRLKADHLRALSDDVRRGLSLLLKKRLRIEPIEEAIPEQLNLFEATYASQS